MRDRPARDTRSDILATARELFTQHGYQRTSLREIAAGLGLTKTAVLYHFPTKQDILVALTQPLLDDLDTTLSTVEHGWAAVEGVLDCLLAHRQVLALSQDPVSDRLTTALARARGLVAGLAPDLGTQVRATQAVAMLADPVLLLADAPTDALRTAILSGVRRLLAPTTMG
ncbi:MAG TPA: helix-turn-helix domain-containing protein [Pseudonocardiaceae bacterium]|nr:helix-turn-helix domain-containing protein [Pseudonocardiaceae bacterium]